MKSQGHSRKNSFVQEKMKFVDSFTSPFKEELLKSDIFNNRHKKALNYGRPKKFAKLKTSKSIVGIKSDDSKIQINIENYEKLDHFNRIEIIKKRLFETKKSPNNSSISSNEKMLQLPLINQPADSIKNHYDEELLDDSKFFIPNSGDISKNESRKKIKESNNPNQNEKIKIELVDGNYVYCIEKKKSIIRKDIHSKYSIISKQIKQYPKPVEIINKSQVVKPKQKYIFNTEKQRDKALLNDLNFSVQSLEKIQGNIYKTLNNAYEGLLKKEYEKVNEKVKKLMNRHITVIDILNNKLLDKNKNTPMLLKINKK
jgi:hypothetical protein